MADVVLDENIYIQALNAECTQDASSYKAARIVAVVQQLHRWILSQDIIVSYRRQFSRTTCRSVLTSQLMVSFNQVASDQTRTLILNAPPVIGGDYHHKDQHMVSAAAAVRGSYLITVDRRLSRQLETAGIPALHGFAVIDVEAALTILTGPE